jgi:hypothetical protein
MASKQRLVSGLSKELTVVATRRLPQEAKASAQRTVDANRSPTVWLRRADRAAD